METVLQAPTKQRTKRDSYQYRADLHAAAAAVAVEGANRGAASALNVAVAAASTEAAALPVPVPAHPIALPHTQVILSGHFDAMKQNSHIWYPQLNAQGQVSISESKNDAPKELCRFG